MRARQGGRGREGAPLCYEFHADFDIIHHLRNAMGFAFPPIRGLGEPAPAPERASRLRSRREIPQSFQFGFTLSLAASRRWCSCHSFYKRSCGEREREPVSFPLNSYVPTPTRVVLRGHVHMMSAKFPGFLTPSLPLSKFVQFSITPSPSWTSYCP